MLPITLHRAAQSQTLRFSLTRHVQACLDTYTTAHTLCSLAADALPRAGVSHLHEAGLPSSARPSTATLLQHPRGFAAAATDGGGVTVVESDEEFRKIMAEHQGKKPCIIDFYAICRQISPYFEELSRTYSGLRFLKVDVDKLNQVTAEASINAVPAFQVWKDGAIVDEFVGASKEDLKALCEKHAAGWS